MGGAFSSNSNGDSSTKKPPGGSITDVDRSMLDLKNARDRLTKYNKSLEVSIEKLVERAKLAKQQNQTQTALGLLRLKKYKQSQVENVQQQLLTVHEMIGTIESQQQNAVLVKSMKAGKDALAKLHAETSVEDVLQLMDDIADQNTVEQEITDIIHNAVPSLSLEQEEAVELELQALEAEMLGGPTTITPTPVLPEVPTKPLPEVQQPQPIKQESEPERERVAIPS